MNDIKIFGIMVVYNKNIKDTVMYKSISGKDICMTVCDNSERDFGNSKEAEGQGFHYISMNGNAGLAKAYNRALDYIFGNFSLSDEDLVCLFDDDTNVPDEYFEVIKKSTGQIILPVVKDGLGIMSPVRMKNKLAARFKNEMEIFECDEHFLSGINSCMAIRAGIFRTYRYNEEMFLDYIDHQFIMDMRERNIYPKAEKIYIIQKFSAVDDDKESAAYRFSLQKKDLNIFYKDNIFCYYYVVIKKHIKLMLKYRDIKMLFKNKRKVN